MSSRTPLQLAQLSLLGLSVGDAFGETFFGPVDIITERLQNRKLQEGNWLFTDDTVMSIGIYNTLAQHQHINQDALAKEFANNYLLDDYRGYGGTAHGILRDFAANKPWQQVSQAVFDGMGSMGNGAAMRSGLIGAYFYNNTDKVIEQSTLAAEITHFHTEAIAGAIAVALAACICTRSGVNNQTLPPEEFFAFIIEHTPNGEVKQLLKKAATLPADYDIRTITAILGNGTRLTAQDTVPFALWCAAHHLTSFSEAIWTGVSGLGDRDTICAIIGSIVVLQTGASAIPQQWLLQTEPFDKSVFYRGGHQT
ncbi:ADP-ribosylglycohydrolase [Filimonas lacunae]|uniref:ADP-ribosylglycohydrolase n=1 Tax=Filimonas lacunae TaxID=477680 RepID=A0A173MH82_9BACT|nr:ADP-ribosylglycohydrolase family protein [Filimonas lacunae]BAV06837.1 hydrolase [Filimonas lacunae]SIS99063.1 ADP-ribosylglycohydrolase [Filimonas lacunae]